MARHDAGAPAAEALGAGATQPPATRVTLAIDTPLGFSPAFVGLATGLQCVEPIGQSNTNPYLFRRTERFLFEHGLTPLSAVKDMIGSQATKGMHALTKFAPHRASCGVWTDTRDLVAIEAYPSACKTSQTMAMLRQSYPALDHVDKTDALTCALVAYLFDQRRDTVNLFSPKHSDDGLTSSIFRHAQVIEDQAGVAIEFCHFLGDAGFSAAHEIQNTHRKAA